MLYFPILNTAHMSHQVTATSSQIGIPEHDDSGISKTIFLATWGYADLIILKIGYFLCEICNLVN